ncbi:MAG: hypothetical protein KGL39_09015 [Patescibacteria group bacterium]|nr:hypothetical protein [Patescibacteria group bacterium]
MPRKRKTGMPRAMKLEAMAKEPKLPKVSTHVPKVGTKVPHAPKGRPKIAHPVAVKGPRVMHPPHASKLAPYKPVKVAKVAIPKRKKRT